MFKPLEWTFFVAPFNFSSYKLETSGIIHASILIPLITTPFGSQFASSRIPPLSTRDIGALPRAIKGQTLVCPSTIHAADRQKSVPLLRAGALQERGD